MKKNIVFFLWLFNYICFAQNAVLKGKITDFYDQSALIGVNIFSQNHQGTASDINGEYNLILEPGEHSISFQYIGYETQVIVIKIQEFEEQIRDIVLKTTSTEMDLVVISAGKFEQKLEQVTVSMDVIKPALIENKNSADLEILMNQSPGVQIVDGQANIRGGSGWSYNTGTRVLVMVDDMPILSGDRGTVNWNMIPMENISQIEVIKGASSVLFGSSAMNGVINVRTSYPKGDPEFKISLFTGIYDAPKRNGLHWWGDTKPLDLYFGTIHMTDEKRRFHGLSFSYAEKKDNRGLVIGGNIYSNDGYKGGFVTNINDEKFGQSIPVSEKWGRFNFSTETNSKKISGLTYGINGNLMFSDQYQSLIFAHDSIGYTPIGVVDGDKPVRFNQMMFNIDPHIKWINSNNNTQHSYKSRFFRDDYDPYNNERAFSNVFFQEYQFQKTVNWDEMKIVSTSGLASNYVKGDYDDIYGEGGNSRIKRLFNYSGYTQMDAKYKKWNLSLGARLENFIFEETSYIIPVIRSGVNYQLAEGTFLRSSFGQGYRYPTIMEMFVKTDYDPVYIYPNPEINPESGWSGEFGIKQLFKVGEWKGMLDFAGFIMYYDDMIEFTFGQWGPVGEDLDDDGIFPENQDELLSNFAGFGFKCVNIGETQITGFEISAIGEGKIGDFNVDLLASYTKVNPVSLNPEEAYYEYEDINGEPIYVDYINASYYTEGNILKYRHENILKFDLNIQYKTFMSGISLRYNSMMKNMDAVFGSWVFNEIDGELPPLQPIGILESRERMTDGDLILDYRLGYNINENVSISFIVDNLLNREYQTRPADLGPPRTFTLKLSAKI